MAESPSTEQQTVLYVKDEPRILRPGGVTLLMMIGILHGLVATVSGLILVLDSDDATLQAEAQLSSNGLTTTGIGMLIAGLLILLLAFALGRGSQFVRWLFGIVTIFNVSFAVWGVVSLHSEQRMTAVFTLVFGLIILWILFGSERTDRFFAQD